MLKNFRMRLFSTDIDGTIYDGPESASLFSRYWDTLRREERPPLLVYNTGRALDDTRALLRDTGLPEPDYLICGVGTVICRAGAAEPLAAWSEQLSRDWDLDLVRRTVRDSGHADVSAQPPACQNLHKSSWFWERAPAEAIDEIVDRIRQRGVPVQAVYSSNRDLDFLPAAANKGNAVDWLGGELGMGGGDIVVAGDSGNDLSMYQVAGARGIVVSNAEQALLDAVRARDLAPFLASRPCAEGVVQGLDHHLAKSPA